jgi:hypothetical protein
MFAGLAFFPGLLVTRRLCCNFSEAEIPLYPVNKNSETRGFRAYDKKIDFMYFFQTPGFVYGLINNSMAAW